MSETSYSHAIRPNFTERIVNELKDGRSVNVFNGNKGVGKTRLLEDIRQVLKQEFPVALIGIKLVYSGKYPWIKKKPLKRLSAISCKKKMPNNPPALYYWMILTHYSKFHLLRMN